MCLQCQEKQNKNNFKIYQVFQHYIQISSKCDIMYILPQDQCPWQVLSEMGLVTSAAWLDLPQCFRTVITWFC
jgi:hypothetical protein